jgi:hypothetical protein
MKNLFMSLFKSKLFKYKNKIFNNILGGKKEMYAER